MSGELITKYVVDSVDGSSLSTIVTGSENGWVEYCNRRGQLCYAFAVTEDFYEKCRQQAIATIVNHALAADKKQLGFIQHLSTVLFNDEFIMPVFGMVRANSDQLEITTGLTRIIASMMNGCTAEQLKIVVYAPVNHSVTQLKNAKSLTSTANFEKIYNLKDIDYEISMSDNAKGDMSEFRFDRSVLKHSIYDKKDQALPHTQLGANIMNFWDRHIRTDKILLNIRCTPEVEKLIQPSVNFNYKVIHENADEWTWSYGKILGAYRKTETPLGYDESQIHLWLYDVTEPVYLELLFAWINGQYTCCHTKNKKALFFDTSNDVTSMQVIGDWVK